MWAILLALLPLILQLIQLLVKTKKLTDNQRRRLNAILYANTQLEESAVKLGCREGGSEADYKTETE